MAAIIVSVVLGALIALGVTISTEHLRKPKLELRISQHTEGAYEDRPAKRARFLHLELVNHPPPWWAVWMLRSAAVQCHGTISFHHLDGQDVFGRTMAVRWSGLPEPVPIRLTLNGMEGVVIDPVRLSGPSRVDVHPGENEVFDVAARFDDEDECYGWSNESYFSDPKWRNPRWKLGKGRYIVKVAITSAGEKVIGLYRLINDVPQSDFKLATSAKGDSVRED